MGNKTENLFYVCADVVTMTTLMNAGISGHRIMCQIIHEDVARR